MVVKMGSIALRVLTTASDSLRQATQHLRDITIYAGTPHTCFKQYDCRHNYAYKLPAQEIPAPSARHRAELLP